MTNKQFISWRRVSTKQQGASGLGLEAQAAIIDYFVKLNGGELIEDFEEVHSGKDLQGCTQLRRAIAQAKKSGAVLIIAKSDRFRDVIEALQVLDEMGDGNIIFCDLPHTDRFTLTLFFALAERERLITSIRTKQALQEKKVQLESEKKELEKQARAAKKSGNVEMYKALMIDAAKKKLGSPNAGFSDEQREKSKQTVSDRAKNNPNNKRAWFAIKDSLNVGATNLARFLNSGGFVTSKGGNWQAVQVQRLIKMYSQEGVA